MRSGITARHRLVRLLALALVAWCAAGSRAGELNDVLLPRPITSAQFEKVLNDAALPAGERAAMDAAFDTYVEEWQRLRDRTLRPLALQCEQVKAQDMKDALATAAHAGKAHAEGSQPSPEQIQADMDAYRQQRDAARAAKAALRTQARQAYERVGQLDARLLAALRAGPRTPEQAQVIDALAQDRTRRLAGAMIRSSGGTSPNRWLARLPAPPKSLEAGAAATFKERADRIERESLPLLQRIAGASMADGDDNHPERADADKLVRMRLKAIDELGALLPADAGTAWVESARARMLRGMLWGTAGASRQEVMNEIGDRMDAAARKRLDRWVSERRAMEEQMLLGDDDWQQRKERTDALKQLNEDAMAELAESTHTPALAEDGFAMRAAMRASSDGDTAALGMGGGEDDDNPFAGMQRRMEARMSAVAESAGGDAGEAGAAAGNPAMAAMQQRGLQRAQVDRMRDALGIPAAQRATWDALADDLLEASAKLHDEKAMKPSEMAAGPGEGMEALARMGDYRSQQQALEDRWFDSIATAFPAISRDTLADQRSRRALQRLRDLGGLARMVSMMTGDRTSDLDLDAIIDRLPAEARARILPQTMAARERRTRDLQASIEAAEAYVRTITKAMDGMQAGKQPDPDRMQGLMKAQQAFGEGAKERAKRAQAAQREELDAMAAVLGEQAGATLQRALRAQQYPEVFRAMDGTDKTIDRVMSLTDLTAEQLTALSAEADAFRVRSDEIADRAIAALEQAEKSQAELLSGAGDMSNPEAMTDKVANMKRTEMANADLDYDRAELAARVLRRMRATLSTQQAKAAGLEAR